MPIKRYDAHTNADDFKSDWHESKDGPMVKYEDYAALAAENEALKDSVEHAAGCIAAAESEGLINALEETTDERLAGIVHRRLCHAYLEVQTPATSLFLAEVRAQGRNEGINYAAGRLAAAFNHGLVDKPLTEVCDVVRMILDAKEELANSTLPAADGLSGEYAERFLQEFAAQLRKGVQS